MSAHYPNLQKPLKVGAHTLKNRVIMGSMHTRLEYLDRDTEREIAFYAERAKGGVALIVSAGCSPNEEGCMEPGSHRLDSPDQLLRHRPITEAVRNHGAKILLQILHAGRYAKHEQAVGPSDIRSPINKFTPRPMSQADIERTVADFIRCARLARDAGYDGVEVMGSEGYLITEFLALRSNNRTDEWGGSLENRCRFAVAIVSGIREALGPDFLVMFRLSALDLVENGLTGDEIEQVAKAVEKAGADILSTGIGWHEAAIPTISFHVPRAAWTFAVARLKQAVKIPVVASNRINTPETAEELLATGAADLVALARPLLADPDFVIKATAGRADEINTCIACNQACLDNIFRQHAVSCLVNPRAGKELDLPVQQAAQPSRIAVIGAGPAGLACAITAAQRGHSVALFESEREIGGQLRIAKSIPDKREFNELLRYFGRQLQLLGVDVRLGNPATQDAITQGKFDRIVIATGTRPRHPAIPGIDHPKVASYADILSGRRAAGRNVAIIGTGGIAHDVADFLLDLNKDHNRESFYREWGVDTSGKAVGGLNESAQSDPGHRITMFQRGNDRPGARLGMTTGWVLRRRLTRFGVETVSGCRYDRIDDQGLHYTVAGAHKTAAVDTIIVCAGQEAEIALAEELSAQGIAATVVGGARLATELDAMRAIEEGTRAAYAL